jgi:hypothetical protein
MVTKEGQTLLAQSLHLCSAVSLRGFIKALFTQQLANQDGDGDPLLL